jgi:hypothetical protein
MYVIDSALRMSGSFEYCLLVIAQDLKPATNMPIARWNKM